MQRTKFASSRMGQSLGRSLEDDYYLKAVDSCFPFFNKFNLDKQNPKGEEPLSYLLLTECWSPAGGPTPRPLRTAGAAGCVSVPWLIKLFQQLEDITS